jgi:hypothetical protein
MSHEHQRNKLKRAIHPQTRALLDEILAFCERQDVTRTSFGVHAVGDGNLVNSLEKGRMPMFSTTDRIRAYIRKQQKKNK